MSIVSSIMITCGFIDESDGETPISCIEKINEWLLSSTTSTLARVDDGFGGGNKFMQIALWAGGFNKFEHKEFEFIEFFKSLPWHYPGETLLIIYPEEGDARVYRPPTTQLGVTVTRAL